MQQFRLSKVFEYEIYCDVEAESLEEAKQLTEKVKWEEADGGERWLILDRWKCCDEDEDLDEVDDWEIEYDGR